MRTVRQKESLAERILLFVAFGPALGIFNLAGVRPKASFSIVLLSIITLIITLPFLPKYVVILVIIYLILNVWFIVPIPVPVPPFRSRLLTALRDARAQDKAARGAKSAGWIRHIPAFFPIGMRIEDAERALHGERFKLVDSRALDQKAISSWSVNGDRLKQYQRYTWWHPLARMGCTIYLFIDQNGVPTDIRAGHYYDGL
jgi:hypothetical protein